MSKATNEFSPELLERTGRLALDNEGQHGSRSQAVMSISSKIGCAPQVAITIRAWVRLRNMVSLSSLSRIRPLKLSTNPFCIGLPGAM